MRLWSLHPKYLDFMGLTAVWREGLLAKKVIKGLTKGYKNHPQLIRFKKYSEPCLAIDYFLCVIHNESIKRGYNFNIKKITFFLKKKHFNIINVTIGQVLYEKKHLLTKLTIRKSFVKFNKLNKVKIPEINPIFNITEGDIEKWENINF